MSIEVVVHGEKGPEGPTLVATSYDIALGTGYGLRIIGTCNNFWDP